MHDVADEAYLFDVDGPISDPEAKQVTEMELMDRIAQKLEAGTPVGFNSGRSTTWIMQNVTPHLIQILSDKQLLSKFIVIGEMANAWVTFDSRGREEHGRSSNIGVVPNELKARINKLIMEKYADAMGILDPKETMLSLEMLHGFDLPTFSALQHQAQQEFSSILKDLDLQDKYEVDCTTIAIDIASPHSGKDLGAKRFLNFLNERKITVKKFKTFGDSISDKAMADELARRGQNVEFIFVGGPSRLGDVSGSDYPIHAIGGYSSGTLKYLRDGQ